MPSADVLLRIRADDTSARCQLGNKYGCEPGEDAVAMLRAAREFRLNVTGVSFHVVNSDKLIMWLRPHQGPSVVCRNRVWGSSLCCPPHCSSVEAMMCHMLRTMRLVYSHQQAATKHQQPAVIVRHGC